MGALGGALARFGRESEPREVVQGVTTVWASKGTACRQKVSVVVKLFRGSVKRYRIGRPTDCVLDV